MDLYFSPLACSLASRIALYEANADARFIEVDPQTKLTLAGDDYRAIYPLGLVPLPSKWLIEFGDPIRTDSFEAGAADDPMLIFNLTDQVRETIQQTLYSLLADRKGVFG